MNRGKCVGEYAKLKEGEKKEVPRGGLVVPKSGRTTEPGDLR